MWENNTRLLQYMAQYGITCSMGHRLLGKLTTTYLSELLCNLLYQWVRIRNLRVNGDHTEFLVNVCLWSLYLSAHFLSSLLIYHHLPPSPPPPLTTTTTRLLPIILPSSLFLTASFFFQNAFRHFRHKNNIQWNSFNPVPTGPDGC
jgi:hypothetical protein